MPIRICLVIALTLLAGTGCGRRGALESPADRIAEPAPAIQAPLGLDTASPGAQEPPAVRPGDAAPQRRFVLDPLI